MDMKTQAHQTILRGTNISGVYCRAKSEQDQTILSMLPIHFSTITGPDGGVFVKYKTVDQVRDFIAQQEQELNRPVYDMTNAAVLYKEATLLVDGNIIAGAIFEGNLFQKGMFFDGTFKPQSANAVLDRRPLTVDVSDLEGEMVGSSKPSYTARIDRATFQSRVK